jgi:hypothetical protein
MCLQGFGYIRIDGSTSAEQRNFFTNKFQEQDNVRIAILSIMAANSGLNLTAASLVVFAELFWNPGVREKLVRNPGVRERLVRNPGVRERLVRNPGVRERLVRNPG